MGSGHWSATTYTERATLQRSRTCTPALRADDEVQGAWGTDGDGATAPADSFCGTRNSSRYTSPGCTGNIQ